VAADIAPDAAELDRSGWFEAATFRRCEWEQVYTAQESVDLQSTASDHRVLEEPTRRQLLNCLARLIDDRYAGRIRKRYLNELRMARRSRAAPTRESAIP
jgi:hypothetical protein